MKSRIFMFMPLLMVVGCGGFGGFGGGVMTEPPSNWQTLEHHSVTVEGSAGNSTSGPILRFRNGAWIGLTNVGTWNPMVVTRPIGVKGEIKQGTGARQGEYVIEVKEWYLQGTSNVPEAGR